MTMISGMHKRARISVTERSVRREEAFLWMMPLETELRYYRDLTEADVRLQV